MKLSAAMNFRFLEGIVAEVDVIKSLVLPENHDLYFFNSYFTIENVGGARIISLMRESGKPV